MSIRRQFELVTGFLEKQQIPYAVTGAFAMYAYGFTRATKDIDFVVHIDAQESIVSFMESLGFETYHCSSGFSNHILSVGSVRIDFVYLDGETAETIFSSTSERLVIQDLKLPVILPEHLIAMKLHAIGNNPDRKLRDLADIKEIIRVAKPELESVRNLFVLYNLAGLFEDVI